MTNLWIPAHFKSMDSRIAGGQYWWRILDLEGWSCSYLCADRTDRCGGCRNMDGRPRTAVRRTENALKQAKHLKSNVAAESWTCWHTFNTRSPEPFLWPDFVKNFRICIYLKNGIPISYFIFKVNMTEAIRVYRIFTGASYLLFNVSISLRNSDLWRFSGYLLIRFQRYKLFLFSYF
jgi:hypothetical protein